MKRKVVFFILNLLLMNGLYFIFTSQALASLDIPADHFGWVLGKYDVETQTFSPSNTTYFPWNNMTVRTIGPTVIWVDDVKEGTIVSFNDKNSSSDNGYPMVEQSQWNAWINLFGGGTNSAFVLKNLKSWYFDSNGKTFANLSQLAELSGGRGLSYSTAGGYITYGKSSGPTAAITPSRYSCKAGESITFYLSGVNRALAYHFVDMTFKDDKGMTYINNKRYLADIAGDSVTKTFTTEGSYLFTLTVNDGVFRYNTKQLLISVSRDNPVDPVQPPEPPPVEPPSPPAAENLPPTAVFSWPDSCYEGETVDVAENSFDLDGSIESRTWNYSPSAGVSADLETGGGTVTLDEVGNFDLKLTVMDDDGALDDVTHSIKVVPAVPTAVITASGTLKENRKVVLDSSKSRTSAKYPIDYSLDEWTVVPVSGGTIDDIKWGARTGSTREILFKKAGTYRVGLRVHNAKYASAWIYRDLAISPDDPPTADFLKTSITYRNPLDFGCASAVITDRTSSPDHDIISQRTWKYKYDSNNDGSFLDEAWVTFDSGNNQKPVLRVDKVGKYLAELEVREDFGQPTILELITEADYRRGDTLAKPGDRKIIEVRNIAPVTGFTAALKPKADIVFSQGFLADYSARFPNMTANLEALVGSKLAAKGIDYSFYNTAAVSIGGPATISKHSTAANTALNPGDLCFTTPSYLYYSPDRLRIYDLGKQIAADSITYFNIKSTFHLDWSSWAGTSIGFSEDGTNWHFRNFGYPAGGLSDDLYISSALLPLKSIRYMLYTNQSSDPHLVDQSVTLTYDSSYNTTAKHIENLVSSYVYDTGRTIYTDAIKAFSVIVAGRQNGFTYSISADGTTWHPLYTGTAIYGNAPAGRYFAISKDSIPISSFRYTKIYFPSWATPQCYDQSISTDNLPRANLADIQSKAGLQLRAGVQKYIVSLAEEPYVDADAATFTNTANALNTNQVNLVVFADAAGTASVQQLTSKVTNHKLITTTYDLADPLLELADYVISTSSSAPLSGIMAILLGQSIGYTSTYSDYENDPKVTDNWYYLHDPEFLDNSSGLSLYHQMNVSGPVETLDKVGKYDIRYKAQDDPANSDIRFSNYRMWSDPSPTTVIVHRKPVADFSVQAGTVNITDLSYDPDFQLRRPDKGIVEWLWKWRPAASAVWTNGKPSAIDALGNYVVHLEVKDVYGAWSDPAEKTITVSTLQRPPVADFNWTPTVIYEGDTVNLSNLSTDPDGDPLTYLWTVFNPMGDTSLYSSTDAVLNQVLPGTYWVTLRATDSSGMSDAVTRHFQVGALGVTGYVKHTDSWNDHRKQYNRHYTGTDDSPRSYDTFWAGEEFVLQAETTDTGLSATVAQSVTAEFLYAGEGVPLAPNALHTGWDGAMWREDFENIPDGPYIFRFTAAYSNGTVNSHDVTVQISGVWLDNYKFHRNW